MKINIIGSFFGIDGYSNHTKQLANALNKLEDIDIILTVEKPAGWERVVSDAELKMLTQNPDDADVNLIIGIPPYWSMYLNQDKPFIGFCVWEGDKIPEFWLENMYHENCKQIWVPSEHTKQAILNLDKQLIDKIKIVPHGVNPNLFYPKEKPNDRLIFFANKGFRGELDRGGIQFLLRAYMEEFDMSDNVGLLFKVNPSYGVGATNVTLNKYAQEIGTKAFAPINLNEDNLNYEDLVNLYNSCNVFVSPSMAEAFNLPCIEAMACGLPVITTDFGGQVDFVNDDNGWILKEGEMFEVEHDIQYEGIQWKRPSVKELRKVMRDIYNNKEQIMDKSNKALKTSKEYSWTESAKKAEVFLKNL